MVGTKKIFGHKWARRTHEFIEHPFNGTWSDSPGDLHRAENTDTDLESRAYTTHFTIRLAIRRVLMNVVMWRFVAHTVARRQHRPRQSQEAWPRSGSSW